MRTKKVKYVIIISAIIMLVSAITLFYSFQSKADEIKPEMGKNVSGNVSMVNNTQNSTSATENIISIPLEKPPFIKD